MKTEEKFKMLNAYILSLLATNSQNIIQVQEERALVHKMYRLTRDGRRKRRLKRKKKSLYRKLSELEGRQKILKLLSHLL